MDRELKEYYENRFAMMNSKAWKDLIDEVEKMLIATDRISGVKDVAALHFKQGEISIMNWLLTLQQVSQATFDDLLEEDEREKNV